MGISTKEISEVIKERLKDFDASLVATDVGRIVATSDGIAQIYGLQNAMAGELLEFPHDTYGLALNLEEDQVRAVILGEYGHLHEGDEVRTTGRLLEVPVGEELIGRVVNPLGVPIDGKGPLKTTKTMPVEKIAPGVITRKRVDSPVQTGIKAIDTMIPIGRGQRELIIGDRFTGKTTVLLDTILNQKGKDLICVYVAIGQNAASIARVAATLEERGAMEYTIIVAASASDPASLNFIAPYAGCAMGEYFMEQGKEALCCYDDLTKQAWAYRELSLNLRRPPGREAYPGDVFYLHSRLLERAAKMSEAKGGGSLTALPVIETQANDVSAFIPTNVISITDGQIYLQSDLFNAGQRPALNVGISVSRVGGDAQTKAMRQVAGQLRLDLAQYRELAAFAQFASDLDTATRNQLERGARLTELLKQDKYEPVPLGEQVAAIYAGTQGFLDKVPTAKVREWEAGFTRFLKSERPAVLAEIEKKKALDDGLFERLKAAISTFNHQFGVEGYSDVADPAGGTSESPSKPSKGEGKKPAPKAESAAPKGQAPAAKAEPKAPAPAKTEKAQRSAKAEPAERPSQLNEIRAAIADSPKKGTASAEVPSQPAPEMPSQPAAPEFTPPAPETPAEPAPELPDEPAAPEVPDKPAAPEVNPNPPPKPGPRKKKN
ncbi:MAG TPA: F0F1 ATP synthase subunit alpha [Candidatus Limnocylindria bacterium]|nr:F0F1 ATP synthase subunit alpha [Candidatus Limnocylindria bacterium]